MDVTRPKNGTLLCSFTVPGRCVPQGSKRYVGRGIMIESNQKQLDDWRSAVRLAAGRAYTRRELFDGPVKVKLVFILQRPKNASKKIEERPGKRPDADKLCRAVFDCLTNVVISDDSRIVDFQAAKYYDYHDLPGCSVEVSEVLELPLRKEC